MMRDRLIGAPQNVEELMYQNGDTEDIISVILYADQFAEAQMAAVAPRLRGRNEMATLRNVWSFVKRSIHYLPDTEGHERIKSPEKTWADAYGDCKSFSVMVGGLLKALGFYFLYRFVGFEWGEPVTHVYVMVRTSRGRWVAIDAVHTDFNLEPDHLFHQDYENTSALSAIRGLPPRRPSFWGTLITGYLLWKAANYILQ